MTALDWEKANRTAELRQRAQRRQQPVVAWWWTLSSGQACAGCTQHVPRGQTVAYNHTLKRAVCEPCADVEQLSPQPSKRYLAAKARTQKPVPRRKTKPQQTATVAVPCPACGARPGQPCLQHGKPRIGFHPSRKKTATRTRLTQQ